MDVKQTKWDQYRIHHFSKKKEKKKVYLKNPVHFTRSYFDLFQDTQRNHQGIFFRHNLIFSKATGDTCMLQFLKSGYKNARGVASKMFAFFDSKQDENSGSEGLVEALINIQKMQNRIINKIKV